MAYAFDSTAARYGTQATVETLARLDRMSRLLDIAFAVPGTNLRFGVEAIIRLIPGIGDLIATGLSTFLIVEAHRLGAPKLLIARMIANVVIEGIAGAVPIVGDAFDVMWRSNRRNLALLRDHLAMRGEI